MRLGLKADPLAAFASVASPISRPMPRKRKLIVSLFEKYEGLKDSIMALEDAVETVRASLPFVSLSMIS